MDEQKRQNAVRQDAQQKALQQACAEVQREDLERMVALMVALLPTLDCPECCDQGHRYKYVELSAAFYRDEWEVACLATALMQRRR